LKIDGNGNLVGQNSFGSPLNDEINAIIKINDKNLLILGNTNRSTNPAGNAWHLIKTTVNDVYHRGQN
jgi:hypothetical protein